jgi:RAI1 like PD-(D/E)XK nuclease
MANISNPEIVGAYSVDKNRNYQGDIGNLKYLKWPEPSKSIDLRPGEYVDKPPYVSEERIHQMTEFLMQYRDEFVVNKRIDANIVCFRGVLKNILAAPYTQESTIVHAMKLHGTIYLCSIASNQEFKKPNVEAEKYSKYGFKFESHVTSSDPDEDPLGDKETLYEAEEFCVMMTRNIGNHKVLFGIESDGVKSSTKINDIEGLKKSPLVEIKTMKSNVTDTISIDKKLKHKSLVWWSQNYIAGIDNVHVGVINNDLVNKYEILNVNRLAEEAKKESRWNPDTCKMNLQTAINKIADDLNDVDDESTIYRYEFSAQDLSFNFKKREGETFFKPEYIQFINEIKM